MRGAGHLAAVVAAILPVACGRATTTSEPAGGATTPSVQVAAPSAVPVDHLAPGELLEGTQQAFGVTLPRDVRIDRNEPGTVYASALVGVHPLVKYLRSRLLDSHLVEGDTFATFDHVKLHDKPGALYHIDITATPPSGARLEWDDVTPQPAPDLPDEAARWRQVGLTPQGRVLDPTHLD
jgi:hypothetical protein